MKLSRENVLHISRLARLGLNEKEVDRLSRQLSQILESFEVLQEVNTEGVLPTSQPNPLCNVLKEDKTKPSLPQNEVLANAPHKNGEFFRVNPVLE